MATLRSGLVEFRFWWLEFSCVRAKPMDTYSIRLTPGQDLKREIDDLAKREKWAAACILTGVGSLTEAAIRFADEENAEILPGPLEIVSISGTLSQDGSHIHILVSDSNGVPTAGHLKEGAVIYTTAEIVFGILSGWQFTRHLDQNTGCAELAVERPGAEVIDFDATDHDRVPRKP